jgi:hypothetical protein
MGSDADMIQFECEMMLNGDFVGENVISLKRLTDNADISASLNTIVKNNNNKIEYLEKILNIVSKTDKSINPEQSAYQSKKELISAQARADIKRDTITNKRK